MVNVIVWGNKSLLDNERDILLNKGNASLAEAYRIYNEAKTMGFKRVCIHFVDYKVIREYFPVTGKSYTYTGDACRRAARQS